MKRTTILSAVALATAFALPMQASAGVAKCYTNAVKSEAKGVKTINQGLAKACKTNGSVENVAKKIAKIADQTNAKLTKIAEKNNKLDSKFSGVCDASVGSTLVTGADPYGEDQSPVPTAETFAAIFTGVQATCNPE